MIFIFLVGIWNQEEAESRIQGMGFGVSQCVYGRLCDLEEITQPLWFSIFPSVKWYIRLILKDCCVEYMG